MTILKDVTVTSEINLASDIANTFSILDIEQMQEGLGLVFEALPADNLTLWSKENGQTQYTCQALTLSAMSTGLDYAVKNQQRMLDKIADDLNDHYKAQNPSEFWNTKAESMLERLAVCEHNLDAIAQVFDTVTKLYYNSTGDQWKPYNAPSKTLNQTATNLEVASVLARLKRA